MKYGLIYYKNTENLGDDILSYAAKRFLPRVDYWIDREAMDVFVPEETEAVAAILNGWYLHKSYAFPPSPYIEPLFVGIHFNYDCKIFGDYSYLEGYPSKYLKQKGPIGCRDTNTMQVLQNNQIDAYLSRCLTMTLEPFADVEKNHKVVLVDVPQEVENYVRQNLVPDENVVCKTHNLSSEEIGWDWERREARVEEYLRFYQGAKVIITTRLHCALPALALGTPVVLVGRYDDDFYDRLVDYVEYLNCFDLNSILEGRADQVICNPVENKSIKVVRDKLIETCKMFVEEIEHKDIVVPEREQYIDFYVNRTYHMQRGIHTLLERQIQLEQEFNEAVGNTYRLADITQKLLTENERLRNMLNTGN